MLSNAPVFAYAPISDIAKGKEFYEGKLGLKPNFEIPGVGVSYQCAKDTAFFMYLSEGAGTNKASTLFWHVEDVYKEVAQLKERGVEFISYDTPEMKTNADDVMDAGPGQAAWFKDPFGNVLAIIAG